MITTKQRAYLRSLSNQMETIFQIGKNGLTSETEKQVSAALEARELIKLRTLETCPVTSREAAVRLAEALHAKIVSVVGSRFVLYRES